MGVKFKLILNVFLIEYKADWFVFLCSKETIIIKTSFINCKEYQKRTPSIANWLCLCYQIASQTLGKLLVINVPIWLIERGSRIVKLCSSVFRNNNYRVGDLLLNNRMFNVKIYLKRSCKKIILKNILKYRKN